MFRGPVASAALHVVGFGFPRSPRLLERDSELRWGWQNPALWYLIAEVTAMLPDDDVFAGLVHGEIWQLGWWRSGMGFC